MVYFLITFFSRNSKVKFLQGEKEQHFFENKTEADEMDYDCVIKAGGMVKIYLLIIISSLVFLYIY